ncbi:hypothetical protein C3Z14_00295 [Proteus mirabilis]|nr:hypothetical protein C3Z14_00295 [Proteus mirabilis]
MNNNLLSISIKLKRINSILIFLFIISFSITLSAPIITYGTQIFLLLPLVFFILIVNGGFKLNKLFYIIFLGLFIFTITYIQSTYLLYKEILWLQTVRIYFWIACCIIVYDSIIKLPISIIQNCIEKIILIFSISVILQSVIYYLFNFVIDYSIFLGGTDSRMSYNNMFRPSGLTSEPAITSGIIISLLSLYYLFYKKLNIIYIIALIACFLSLSTIGIILASIFFIIAFSSNRNILLYLMLIPLIVFILAQELTYRYSNFVNGLDNSNNIKLEVAKTFFDSKEIFWGGFGFIGKSASAPNFYEALYDSTFLGNTFIIFGIPIGIIILILFVLFVFKLNLSLKEKSLIFLSLLKTSSPTFSFFNVFILLLIVISKKRKA